MLFETQLFTKSNARELLAEQRIELQDDFTFSHNHSNWGAPGDYYHTFSLYITNEGKESIIREMKNTKDYIGNGKELTFSDWMV